MLKRTPLYAVHQMLGGRLIDFGGWEMPVQYTGIVHEHHAVRAAAGLFDISHMGEILVHGERAAAFLNAVLTNDISRLPVGMAQYTLMCNEQGGVVDDLYAYRLAEKQYLLMVNASRIGEDFSWLRGQMDLPGEHDGTILLDVSDKYGALAVQGPKVAGFIDAAFEGKRLGGFRGVDRPTGLEKNQLISVDWHGNPIWISRTGYTGEDGFELIATEGVIEAVWNRLVEAGTPFGLRPAGLGARDTLRTEACFPLYGHELDEAITPLEAGLGYFVALDKPDFSGRDALVALKEAGLKRRCVAFKMAGKAAPPRPHYPVVDPGNGQCVGEVSSGTQSPSLGCGIGLAYVPVELARPGTALEIEIRNRRFPAEVVKKPFYRKAH